MTRQGRWPQSGDTLRASERGGWRELAGEMAAVQERDVGHKQVARRAAQQPGTRCEGTPMTRLRPAPTHSMTTVTRAKAAIVASH